MKYEKSDSSKVQHILGSTSERALDLWQDGYELIYNIFDVIKWDGQDLTRFPLLERAMFLNTLYAKLDSFPIPLNIRVEPFNIDLSFGHYMRIVILKILFLRKYLHITIYTVL